MMCEQGIEFVDERVGIEEDRDGGRVIIVLYMTLYQDLNKIIHSFVPYNHLTSLSISRLFTILSQLLIIYPYLPI